MIATFIAVSTSGARDVEIVVRAEYGIVGEPLDAAFSKFLVDSRLNFLFELFQRFRRAQRAMRQTRQYDECGGHVLCSYPSLFNFEWRRDSIATGSGRRDRHQGTFFAEPDQSCS